MKPLGIALVGCGVAAMDISRAVDAVPDGRVVAVFDRVPSRAAQLARTHGALVHDSLDGVLDDEAVDIVYIGLPHHLLAPTTERALRAGRHVLVEKPAALNPDQLRELISIARQEDRRVGVMFELRELAVMRQARRLVRDGAVGEVRAVRIRTVIDKPLSYWASGPRGLVADGWRARRAEAGGGVMLMNSIHQLDLVSHITGLSFTRAAGEIATATPGVEVEDIGSAVLRMSNGAVATLAAAAHSPGAAGEESIEIDGSQGRLDLPDPYSGQAALRIFSRRPWQDIPAGQWTRVAAEGVDCYTALVRGFLQAVRSGEQAPVGLDDAIAVLATVLAVYRSAQTGTAVPI